MKHIISSLLVGFGLIAICLPCAAELPGEARPKPVLHPTEKVGATGMVSQATDLLPKSRAPFGTAQRKPKLPHRGMPELRDGNQLVLNAGWDLIEAPRSNAGGDSLSKPGVDTYEWYDAIVPGTVLNALVQQGVYPDPYFGLNNLVIPETLNKQDYWYRTEFTVPKAFAGRELWLEFGGINYYAEVWLNGTYLGHITGAFIRGQFNVTPFAHCGATNVLAVMVAPPPDPGLPSEQSVKFGPGGNGGKLCLDGPTFECTEGWDWIPGIRDRCTGLWQDVILRATGPVVLGDPQVVTHLPLPDITRAEITLQTELRNATPLAQAGVLEAAFEGVKVGKKVSLQPAETKAIVFTPQDFPQLLVKKPRLWWPNGYGTPELYHLQLTFKSSDHAVSDRKTLRFGIREMSYELAARVEGGAVRRFEYFPTAARNQPAPVIDVRRESMNWPMDAKKAKPTVVALSPGAEGSTALRAVTDVQMGSNLVVKVNGQRVLCRGGNWGMDDALKRIARDRLEPYVRMHRDAHLTMIRNWAGQSTSEAFYDLCDEYGILVWNDFWLNTENWNYTAADHELFLRNVADTLRRYRNHPSIALWCPRNEGVPPEPLNTDIDRAIREIDGTRYYQPNSRLVNLLPSGPWSNQPLEKYFLNLNRGFSTELGASSIPTLAALRSMMAEPDLWPPEDVWAYHDFHSKGAGDRAAVLGMIQRRYGEAQNVEDLCRKAQMVNYETYRAMFEGYNSRLWKPASGVLVWMSHPSWPSVVWQFYSWDYEPNASLFGAQKGCEMVHVQMNLPDCQIAVVNHTAKPLENVKITAVLRDLQGKPITTNTQTLSAAADMVTEAFVLAWPEAGAHLVSLELRDRGGHLLSENFYWHARTETDLQQLNNLPPVALTGKLHARTKSGQTLVSGKLSNPGTAPALAIRLALLEAGTGRRILPVYYRENYFSLLPGESREIAIECPMPSPAPLELSLDGWNIKPQALRP